jgi:ABC-type hemin transport system substrate-binding protein
MRFEVVGCKFDTRTRTRYYLLGENVVVNMPEKISPSVTLGDSHVEILAAMNASDNLVDIDIDPSSEEQVHNLVTAAYYHLVQSLGIVI